MLPALPTTYKSLLLAPQILLIAPVNKGFTPQSKIIANPSNNPMLPPLVTTMLFSENAQIAFKGGNSTALQLP